MAINWKSLTRKTHYWAALAIVLPALVIIGSGLVLQLKKDVNWIQPSTIRGMDMPPSLSFAEILAIASSVEEAQIDSWDDIDRLDVRTDRGMLKVRAKNRWEVQLDSHSGDILQVAYRRSDLIETIHDGSFFHNYAKLGLFLPTAAVLFLMWATGVYLFVLPFISRHRKRIRLSRKGG